MHQNRLTSRDQMIVDLAPKYSIAGSYRQNVTTDIERYADFLCHLLAPDHYVTIYSCQQRSIHIYIITLVLRRNMRGGSQQILCWLWVDWQFWNFAFFIENLRGGCKLFPYFHKNFLTMYAYDWNILPKDESPLRFISYNQAALIQVEWITKVAITKICMRSFLYWT